MLEAQTQYIVSAPEESVIVFQPGSTEKETDLLPEHDMPQLSECTGDAYCEGNELVSEGGVADASLPTSPVEIEHDVQDSLADREQLAMNQAISVSNVGDVLDAIIVQRKDWEGNEFVRSNQRLYKILQTCYELFQSMTDSDAESRALQKAFLKYCKSKGLNFKSSTTLMSKIVRCVFSDDRRRISAYALALQVAADQKIKAEDIPDFFTRKGGVEELRRTPKANSSNRKQKSEIGKRALSRPVLVSVKSSELDQKFDDTKCKYALLLATKEPDGTFAVHELIQNRVVIEKAFESLARSITQEEQAKLAEEQALAAHQAREDAIQEIAA